MKPDIFSAEERARIRVKALEQQQAQKAAVIRLVVDLKEAA